MAEKHLGPEFEIHGGGLDLRFPHHENELAQSRSRGYPFADIWLHNGMLELGDEKMSKSLGNVVTLRNVLDTWGREVLLLYHLSGHWRNRWTCRRGARRAPPRRVPRGGDPGTGCR
jgi:cysteinyl-tRNA synthetase